MPQLLIESLNINNFATIKNQYLEFQEGFNVIVGETGSGKSLILDALQLTFGTRAEKKLVRKGSKFSSVEVEFRVNQEDYQEVSNFCEELGFPMERNVHIKRVIYKEGSSKAYLNHQACPLNVLTRFTRKYIDLVGQFENQKLLSSSYQLKLLDSFASLENLFGTYSNHYTTLTSLEEKLKVMESKFLTREREIDYLEYQLKEFENISPSTEREDELLELKSSFLNSERLLKLNEEFRFILLEEGDGGVFSKLRKLSNVANQIPHSSTTDVVEKLNSAEAILQEVETIVKASTNETAKIDENFEDILDELDGYQKLKRKFNLSTDELSSKEIELRNELGSLLKIENEIKTIIDQIKSQKEVCLNLSQELHKCRVSASKTFSKELTSTVQKLNMNGAQINFQCSEKEDLGHTGITDLNLMAQTNPGEGFYKLNKIASGGELSRILLSLRHLLTTQDSISVFLFDEIDTGIGGKTALKIGEMLKEISTNSQVIAITHLPQIANFSNNLIAVEKETKEMRTETKIQLLSGNDRKNYLKEMSQLEI